MQEVFGKIKERLKEAAWMTQSTFDCDGYSNDDSEEVVTLDNAIEIVNQVAEEYSQSLTNDGWIPCSERFPENDSYIMLSFKNFSIPQIGRYEEDEEGGAFFVGDDDVSCSSYNLFVNAWRPLPEPYKGE